MDEIYYTKLRDFSKEVMTYLKRKASQSKCDALL